MQITPYTSINFKWNRDLHQFNPLKSRKMTQKFLCNLRVRNLNHYSKTTNTIRQQNKTRLNYVIQSKQYQSVTHLLYAGLIGATRQRDHTSQIQFIQTEGLWQSCFKYINLAILSMAMIISILSVFSIMMYLFKGTKSGLVR